jgi:tetratricopeptide (TPR) repeat protein
MINNCNLSFSFEHLNDHISAIAAKHRALSLKPDHPTNHFNLGIGYQDLGFYRVAIEHYKATVKLNNTDFDAFTNLANMYVEIDERTCAF